MTKDKEWFEMGDDWMFNTASIVAARKTEDTDGKVVEVYLYTAASLERLDQYVPTDVDRTKQPDAPIHFAGPQAQVVWEFINWGSFDLGPRLDLAKRDWEKPPGDHDPAITVEQATAWLMTSMLLLGEFGMRFTDSDFMSGSKDEPRVKVYLPGMDRAEWMTVREAADAIHFIVGQIVEGE